MKLAQIHHCYKCDHGTMSRKLDHRADGSIFAHDSCNLCEAAKTTCLIWLGKKDFYLHKKGDVVGSVSYYNRKK